MALSWGLRRSLHDFDRIVSNAEPDVCGTSGGIHRSNALQARVVCSSTGIALDRP